MISGTLSQGAGAGVNQFSKQVGCLSIGVKCFMFSSLIIRFINILFRSHTDFGYAGNSPTPTQSYSNDIPYIELAMHCAL